MNDTSFVDKLIRFNRDGVDLSTERALHTQFIRNPDFTPKVLPASVLQCSSGSLLHVANALPEPPLMLLQRVGKHSQAAATLCSWVKAIHVYAKTHRSVAPLRAERKALSKTVKAARRVVADIESELDEHKTRLHALRDEVERLDEEARALEQSLLAHTKELASARESLKHAQPQEVSSAVVARTRREGMCLTI